jgi:hypothetical protein
MTTGDVDVAAGDWEREPDPSDSLRTFGAVVQALREHAGLSRVDFGARVRFSSSSRTSWSCWLNFSACTSSSALRAVISSRRPG